MPRRSFRDAITNVLTAHGFVETNAVGDISRIETDDFSLEPGKWQWDGTQWAAFTPPPLPPNPLKAKIDAALASPLIPQPLKDLLIVWKTQL